MAEPSKFGVAESWEFRVAEPCEFRVAEWLSHPNSEWLNRGNFEWLNRVNFKWLSGCVTWCVASRRASRRVVEKSHVIAGTLFNKMSLNELRLFVALSSLPPPSLRSFLSFFPFLFLSSSPVPPKRGCFAVCSGKHLLLDW